MGDVAGPCNQNLALGSRAPLNVDRSSWWSRRDGERLLSKRLMHGYESACVSRGFDRGCLSGSRNAEQLALKCACVMHGKFRHVHAQSWADIVMPNCDARLAVCVWLDMCARFSAT